MPKTKTVSKTKTIPCWSCKVNDMEPEPTLGNHWYKCKCGATYYDDTGKKGS